MGFAQLLSKDTFLLFKRVWKLSFKHCQELCQSGLPAQDLSLQPVEGCEGTSVDSVQYPHPPYSVALLFLIPQLPKLTIRSYQMFETCQLRRQCLPAA